MYTIAHQHFQLDNVKTLIISFRSDLCVEKVSTMYREELTLSFTPINYDDLNSYEWEDLIEKYLLKLKQFTLYIIPFENEMDIAQALIEDDFLQNQFWLDRKTKIEIIDGESIDNDDMETKIMIKFSI
ncbi:unnamed protein product [Adineta steineri]|uniref:Uncharacterized protein n=1 Tax=Adineta steineri TaxID=433720 RepID=A0A813R8C7_9BILA|nr:unnamed protein product [Adineta steineri]